MKRKAKKLFSLLLAAAIFITGIPAAELKTQAAETEASTQEYEIYPMPQEGISYGADVLELGNTANLVIENTIDTATITRLNDILELKSITGTRTDNVASGTLNVLAGTKGSGGAVEQWFDNNITYNSELFDKQDAYVLSIKDNVIAVLGKDTDAAFYGLSTLKLIINQAEGATVRELQIEDYADGQYRGFIEGYYGIPWSVEDRISLMEFGGDFKMNIYIFAPKDDEYHNSNWRTLYPDDKLEDIREMVAAGTASKCRFAWAIHPFMHDKITSANYNESLQIVKNKFQQLYDAGVRQFVISADDAVSDAQVQANLCRDMSAWVKEHDGTYNLVFVPQVYCTAAASWGGGYTVSTYFNYFKNLTDVELMWTGEWVCHPASQNTFTNFKSKAGKEAFMWLNWPVNDVNHKRLVMGPAEEGILSPGLTDFRGIVTNPLQQAEASKTSLFAIADFAWNTSDFSCFTSWEDGFKYIDAGAPEALTELCRHLTNPSPGGITSMGESTELEPYITAFTNDYNADRDITASGTALIEQFQKIITAADEFQQNGTNENLKVEMKPWVDSLRYISKACAGYVETALALKKNDADTVCGSYLTAINNYKASKNCESPLLTKDGDTQYITTHMVEAGAMKIMPFAREMDTSLKEAALEVLNGNFSDTITSAESSLFYQGLGGFYEGDAEKVIDGMDNTYAWFNTTVSANAYIGLDLGDAYKLDTIRILQGRTNSDGDIFTSGVLEYSLDNEHWTSIGTYGTNVIEENVLSQSINARYVRLRTTAATGKWYSIREFSVTTRPLATFVYTNVDDFEEYPTDIDKTTAGIPEIEGNLTLKSGEYIGMAFTEAREITSLTADYTNKDKLALEYSYNGFDWYPVENSFESIDAKYIRLINKNSQDVSFHLAGISLQNNAGTRSIFATPEGKEGHEASKAADGSILTSFVPSEGNGELTWRIDAGSADSLYVLQDASVISDAKVFVRTNAGKWNYIGTLSNSLNTFENLLFYGPVNEVKIEWKEKGPVIYETYTKKTERTDTEQLQAIIAAAEEETKQELYTPESYNNFAQAITAAKELLEQSASAEDKAEALKSIYEAAGSLVLQKEAEEENKQAKKDLADAVTSAKTLIDAGGSKYTETSWNTFVLAYHAAAEVSENADTATVKRLLLALQKAEKELILADGNNTENPPGQTPGDPSVKPPVQTPGDPSVKPPVQTPGGPSVKPPAPTEDTIKKGDTDIWKNLRYQVTDAAKKQVEVYGVKTKSMTKVTIPATAKVKGIVCTVTSVSKKAFAGMKKLKSVTIGKNITTIGTKAFYNDKKLKTIIVKSKVLKKVAKDALLKTYKKGTIKVPKSKKKSYTKLFKKRGQKKIK